MSNARFLAKGIRATNDKIQFNVDAKVDSDNARDFGSGGARWKDLYLSGGVYLGGTGAANKITDYETGNWTPSLGGNASYDIQYGRYAKVGDLVYIRFAIRSPTLGTGSTYSISGLPFTASSEMSGLSVGYYDGAAVNFYAMVGTVENSVINIYLKTSITNNALQSTNFFQNNTRIYASSVYRTT